MIRPLSNGAAFLLIIACSSDKPAGNEWETVRANVGDTTVVRTVGAAANAGERALVAELTIGDVNAAEEYTFAQISELRRAPDGGVLVFDNQLRTLRRFDSAGKFVATIGRRGSGPGEHERANGLAILPNRQIVIWDAGAARLVVFSWDGARHGEYKIPGGASFNTNGAVSWDTAGFTYVRSRVGEPPGGANPAAGTMFGITGLLRYSASGDLLDSLQPPTLGLVNVSLVASVEGNTTSSGVPFSPREMWNWSPLGFFVAGRGDRYAVHIVRPNGGSVLRFERELEPVSVSAAEREDAIASATDNMRQTDPNWRWNGPEVPATKPFMRGFMIGDDGRVWVQVSTEGEVIPEEERPTRVPPEGGEARAYGPRYREKLVYDVFAPDGVFLGRVNVPARTSLRAAVGNEVWGIRRDENDVQQIVRFRVSPPFVAARQD